MLCRNGAIGDQQMSENELETAPTDAPASTSAEEIAATDTAMTSTADESASVSVQAPPGSLDMEVQITELGPCQKRIRVSISQNAIQEQFRVQLGEMVRSTWLPGYRPGKAPRKLIERKMRDEVREHVRSKLLMRSLEELGERHKIEPIAEPKLDVKGLEVPESGPMCYEFDVEVSPTFTVPEYKQIKIKRPVHEFSEKDVDAQLRRFLEGRGTLVPCEKAVEKGDYVVVDVKFTNGDEVVSTLTELTLAVQPTLRFRDGTVEKFDEALAGVRAGESRSVDVLVGAEAPAARLRGLSLKAEFAIKDVKQLRLPELTREFLSELGYETEEQLRDALYSVLQRRLEYDQRRSARQQLMDQLIAAVPMSLPTELVRREVQRVMRRRVRELRDAGHSDAEIRQQEVMLRQNSLRETDRALREHFILTEIAGIEKLELGPKDLDRYIEALAIQNDDSPRRVRARLEKENLTEEIQIQILEQLAVDRILDYAEYENVPLVKTDTEAEVVDTATTESASATAADPEGAEPASTASPVAAEPAPEVTSAASAENAALPAAEPN